MKTLDVCGLSCPEPVVRTMAALKALPTGESITVIADTATARDNVVRTAGNMNCDITVEADGKQYKLALTRR
mgnify:CR=1 FL=1|jgi:TusA-related sulfurtransferase